MTLINQSTTWNDLFKIGGIAALILVVLTHLQMAVFFIWPPPSTVTGWFILFQNNAIIGLLDMDLLLVVDYVLLIIIFLAFWASLRQYNTALVTLALVIQIVSVATYFSSAVVFEMFSLSNQYSTAATDSQRSLLLTAGSIMLANWQGTAFDVSYILGCAATLLISVMMLRSHIFSKATAYFGIAAGAMMVLPPSAGSIAQILSLASVPTMAVWLVLSASRLLKLGTRQEKLSVQS